MGGVEDQPFGDKIEGGREQEALPGGGGHAASCCLSPSPEGDMEVPAPTLRLRAGSDPGHEPEEGSARIVRIATSGSVDGNEPFGEQKPKKKEKKRVTWLAEVVADNFMAADWQADGMPAGQAQGLELSSPPTIADRTVLDILAHYNGGDQHAARKGPATETTKPPVVDKKVRFQKAKSDGELKVSKIKPMPHFQKIKDKGKVEVSKAEVKSKLGEAKKNEKARKGHPGAKPITQNQTKKRRDSKDAGELSRKSKLKTGGNSDRAKSKANTSKKSKGEDKLRKKKKAFNKKHPIKILKRSRSHDSGLSNPDNTSKWIKRYVPRRVFSFDALEPMRVLLNRLNQEQKEKQQSMIKSLLVLYSNRENDDDEEDQIDFGNLSPEAQLNVLESKNWIKNIDFNKDFSELKSLTGGKEGKKWKFQDSFYGNFNVGRRPSMDTAWGRRVFDQYEIDIEVKKHRHSYLGDTTPPADYQEFGLWDAIYSSGIITTLEGAKKWKPDRIDINKELKKHGLAKEELLTEDDLVLDPSDPVSAAKMRFLPTGNYLRPVDMEYCIANTNFSEEEIFTWFKSFRTDCPDGKLTRSKLRELFKTVYPHGNPDVFCRHIMRIFDSDGNDYLDFKEFLLAMDISQCETDESKLNWAFKLYDVDNDGMIDLNEISVIMETLDSIEGNTPGQLTYDANGNPEPLPSALERAASLFNALDENQEGTLTKEEFLEAYTQRNAILKRKDADEQRRKRDCLLFLGPLVKQIKPDAENLTKLVVELINKHAEVPCQEEDIAFTNVRQNSDDGKASLFVRFQEVDMRLQVWGSRGRAKKNQLFMEEWLTEFRTKLVNQCKKLRKQGIIDSVFTRNGDVYIGYEIKGETSKKHIETERDIEDVETMMKRIRFAAR